MIEIKGLYKSFNGQEVLKGIDLTIPKGQITVILGPSGAGKSVFLKHLIGLMKPDRGRILVDGRDINRMGPKDLRELRKRFGMLFQEGALFDSMTVADNIAFPLLEHTQLNQDEIWEIVQEKLSKVGLLDAAHKFPSELSGGMKKRAALARALALNPEYVLCDEPTGGLDPVSASSIERLILETQRSSASTFVIITHDLATAIALGDKLALLEDGRIVVEGGVNEVLSSGHPLVEAFLQRRERTKEVRR